MGRNTTEQAKLVIIGIEVANARVVRFTVTTGFGFGLILLATREGETQWVSAVMETANLTPDLNRWRVADNKTPREYLYEIFVEVPEGWSPKQ